jgi:23S rRNA pseudouridine2605 synthase
MPQPPRKSTAASPAPRHGVARAISKLGLGSRTQAAAWVGEGRVRVNGRVVSNPEFPVRVGLDLVEVAGLEPAPTERIVLMLNKPRGLVTTTRDERGRDTVYECLRDAALPWLAPVGRLDKASEGLLLFCNDPAWAARITGPGGPDKRYHVQVDALPDAAALRALITGVEVEGDFLRAKSATLLRSGDKHAWLDIVLDEGRNRQIRRLLAAQGYGVLRLVRVAIGALALGELGKGRWRRLRAAEIDALGGPLAAPAEALRTSARPAGVRPR